MAEMHEFTAKYEIAGLKILMTTYFDKTRELAKDYLAKSEWDEPDYEIIFDKNYYEENKSEFPEGASFEDMEYVLTGEYFHRLILDHNGLMLHSSAVVVDGYSYLFSADSGTGKSTHTNLWLEKFGEDAFIINDDKPAVRKIDGQWYVYGTPWCGKHSTNKIATAKLGAIVFLERSENNWIEPENVKDAIPKVFKQTTRKLYLEEYMDKLLSHIEQLLEETPLYKMGCDISKEAVDMAYEKIRRV